MVAMLSAIQKILELLIVKDQQNLPTVTLVYICIKFIRRGGGVQKVFSRTDPSDGMRQNDGSINQLQKIASKLK